MQHLVAYYEAVDGANTLQPIAAVPDAILYVVGDQVRVPNELAFAAGGVMLTNATTVTQAQLRTPTLREVFYPSLSPIIVTLGLTAITYDLAVQPDNPMALTGLEQMEVWQNTDNAGASTQYAFVFLQDGPVQPVKGPMFTIRATGAATLVSSAWVNTQLTFDQQLPVGDYQVVGMRAVGTNLRAARLVFQGYAWRPGVIASATEGSGNFPIFRFGRSGVLGTFNNNVPPTVDCIGDTDTAQVFYLDLIKVS